MRKQLMERILVIVGVSMMAFPFLRLEYGEYQVEKRIDAIEEVVRDRQSQVKNRNREGSIIGERKEADSEKYIENAISDETGMGIGMIEIEKIDLQYPIVNGAGQKELRFAVGHVEGTAGIGEKGNCVLAGHRGSRYGAFFKRIGELVEGDVIRLMDEDGVWYEYVVLEKFVVSPNEVWVLEHDGEEKVTLISCENGGRERIVVVGRKNGIDSN